MKKGFDIHKFEIRFNGYVKKIENSSEISDNNKKIISRFIDDYNLKGITVSRLLLYLGVLYDAAKVMQVDYDNATEDDIKKYIRELMTRNYSEFNFSTKKALLKSFYKWLKKSEDTYPKEVKWISTKVNRKNIKKMTNADLLTEEDIRRMIDVCRNPRDKALIAILWETGARIGEILSLQMKNITLDEYGAILDVEGKTGSRSVRIVSSIPYLMTYLEYHPGKDKDEYPLWLNYVNGAMCKWIKYSTVCKNLKKIALRSGINKRCNPHKFRHSRASFLANHFTEFQMNQYLGWVQGSNMPSTYIHLSGMNLENSILKLHGFEEETKKHEEIQTKPIICNRCNTKNLYDSKYCKGCAAILDMSLALNIDQKKKEEQNTREKYDKLMNKLMDDPEFFDFFKGKVANMKTE